MARCDEGYRCQVCGADVDHIADSDLYLRFVLGEVDPETLHLAPDRHIRCNPVLAQFIQDPAFPPIRPLGPFDRDGLDPAFVAEETSRVTAGYLRLLQLATAGDSLPITAYPLPGMADHWTRPEGDPEARFDRFNRP